ncbi:hypothetical protein Pcinc_040977 [Petrolisthes cinctipes]|uniref:Uncharacterized protein n=1 Tax=Petrolisthes cinctipes TaxID=88211 RepID=A0AAE1EIX8_PETCI|nr:hypothetical protein Pcinc_040977 [Petrolisthes cinctipes]
MMQVANPAYLNMRSPTKPGPCAPPPKPANLAQGKISLHVGGGGCGGGGGQKGNLHSGLLRKRSLPQYPPYIPARHWQPVNSAATQQPTNPPIPSFHPNPPCHICTYTNGQHCLHASDYSPLRVIYRTSKQASKQEPPPPSLPPLPLRSY